MPTKVCTKCLLEWPATAEHWYLAKKGKFGLSSVCKPCSRALQVIRRRLDPEKRRSWYHRNKDRAKSSLRAAVKRRKESGEHQAMMAAWREQNREEIRRKHREWSEQNRDRVRMAKRVSQAKRRSLGASDGHHSPEDIKRLLAAQKGRCWWCEQRLEKYHVDHRIPLSKGGSNSASNLVIACPPCNLSRRDKMPWEWKAPRLL